MKQPHPLAAALLAAVVLLLMGLLCDVLANASTGFWRVVLYVFGLLYFWFATGHAHAAWRLIRDGR